MMPVARPSFRWDPMPSASVQSPILLIVFNRLDTALQVMHAIAQARPTSLFVAADGPRADRPGEADRVRMVRDAVLARIDWPCEVRTLFRDTNLGCRDGVRTAIDWFFEQVPAGIILEDDVVPSADFFTFCDTALTTYADDERVYMVSGTNMLGAGVMFDSYSFSSFGSIWGWASWRRAWTRYDVTMAGWGTEMRRDLVRRFGQLPARYLSSVIDGHVRFAIDTWDTQWLYTMLRDRARAVLPHGNLITNVGVVGTHSSVEMSTHHLGYGTMRQPLRPASSPDVEDTSFLRIMTRRIYLPAMAISAGSRIAKRLRLHNVATRLFRLLRTKNGG